MKVFTGKRAGRIFFVRIDEGDDVIEGVNSFIVEQKVVNGIVTSAIGTLSNAVVYHITTTNNKNNKIWVRAVCELRGRITIYPY